MSRRPVKRWAGRPVEELRRRWKRQSVHAYGKIDSTNAAARELAEEGASPGTIVLAREQTSGRGRGERRWYSPPGGVYLSMVFRPEEADLSPLVSVLAALGVVRELDRAFPELSPALKWPNDVVVEGRKLGGVLPEAVSGERRIRHLVVGVGVNVKLPGRRVPPALRKRATWLEEHVEDPDPLRVADAVVAGLEAFVRPPPRAADPATLELLDRYDWLRDRRVRFRPAEGGDGIPGVSVGIAPDGALLFRPDRGALRRLSGGSVEVDVP